MPRIMSRATAAGPGRMADMAKKSKAPRVRDHRRAAPRRQRVPARRRRLREHAGVRRREDQGQGGAGRRTRPSWGPGRRSCYAESKGGGTGRCCWSCRAWTPPARAASCATSSARSTPRGSGRRRSRPRPRRSASTTSCGGSATPCRVPGKIGVFDRSHYEDVLVVRVHDLVPAGRVVEALRADQRLRARGHRRRAPRIVKVMTAHLQGRAEGPAARTARTPGQALQVQPRRRRRAGALGRLHGGVPGGAHADVDEGRRPGTSSPPTRSGTRGTPSSSCSSTR